MFYGAGCAPLIIQSGPGLAVPVIYEFDGSSGLKALSLQWPVGLPPGLHFVGSMDANGDDLPELFMSSPDSDVIYLLTGDGRERWEVLQRIPGGGIVESVFFSQLSSDGWPDLAAGSPGRGRLAWFNVSGLFVPVHPSLTRERPIPFSFPPVPAFRGSTGFRHAADNGCGESPDRLVDGDSDSADGLPPVLFPGQLCGDFDNDGDQDRIGFDQRGGKIAWSGESGSDGRSFVRVSLFGPPENRAGVGARVLARVAGQWAPVPPEARSLAHRVLPLSFRVSVPEPGSVDALLVLWPDGRRTRIDHVPMETVIRVRHPSLAMLSDPATRLAVEKAIQRARAWFSQRDLAALSFDVPVALAIMERRLPGHRGFSPVAAYDAHMERARQQGDSDLVQRMLFWRRLLTSTQERPGPEYSALPYYDPVVVPGLYCDRHPLPAGYGDLLMDTARSGGYGATHALMGYWWLTDNRCAFRLSRQDLAELLYRTLQTFSVVPEVNDVSIEAFTLLVATGREDVLEPAQLDKLLAAQNPDGGWPMIARPGTPSNGHSTVLAYWGLQLLRHFNQVHQPAVPRGGSELLSGIQ